MLKVNFHELGKIQDNKLLFAVIMAKYKEQWIFVKHKKRDTWEIPGGHRENNEDINDTASRELFEETGAKDFTLKPICVYSVKGDEGETFGQLFYAEVQTLEKLPNSEIGEVEFFKTLPKNLTYPLIQPFLFEKVLNEVKKFKNYI
ncbi:NUDIX hydrolase [Clostridium ganghwense]|uniref:NUDIX domain-containing protein n=1 Tax=Clostridium ganghwense TaxID=312089 RepID=A0ABT4CUA7_9CLOT|nr:NUDIX domain-containing protein [Clostridium ganghwense]MCY6372642.1 NUDIX domain-containing protein [Clostridium ganghwense]